MLRLDLCDYSDVYIVVKGDISLRKTADRYFIDVRNRFLAFKNRAVSIDCISKINGVLMENTEDIDVVMPKYNLLEYSKNYTKRTGSLWNYYRNGPNIFGDDYNAIPITNSESFEYKINITGKPSTANQENGENAELENSKTKKIWK